MFYSHAAPPPPRGPLDPGAPPAPPRADNQQLITTSFSPTNRTTTCTSFLPRRAFPPAAPSRPNPPPRPDDERGRGSGIPPTHTHTQHTPPRPRASGPSGRGGSAVLDPETPSPRRGVGGLPGAGGFGGPDPRKSSGARGGDFSTPKPPNTPTTTAHLRGALPLASSTPSPRYPWDGGVEPALANRPSSREGGLSRARTSFPRRAWSMCAAHRPASSVLTAALTARRGCRRRVEGC